MKKLILLIMLLVFMTGCTVTDNSSVDTSPITTNPKEETTTQVWSVKYYVDEFDNPTSTKYMTATFDGTFSNSATTKSKLKVRFLIDYCSYSLKLYEYGNSVVKNYHSRDKWYNVTILTQDKNKVHFDAHMDASSDRLYLGKCNTYNQIFNESEAELLKILNKEGEISIYIEEHNDSLTNYLFTVDLTDFKKHFANIQFE